MKSIILRRRSRSSHRLAQGNTIDEGVSAQQLVVFGTVTLILGATIYILNFERKTILLRPGETGIPLVHYMAPTWDPFPHTLRVTVMADVPVDIVVVYSGAREETVSVHVADGNEEWVVLPGEVIASSLENPLAASGVVKTVLWCDSWNYTATIFIGLGFLLLALAALARRWRSRRARAP